MRPEGTTSNGDRLGADLAGIAALADPVRRTLYGYVAQQAEPVSRDQVVDGTGLAHHVVKFNLDRLVAEGLLDFGYRRPPGRSGPGSGRPAKVYRRSARQLAVSVPTRRYELAARLLASAIRQAQEQDIPIGDALRRTATDTGRTLGREVADRAGPRPGRRALSAAIQDVLDDLGYETRREGPHLTLGNCPFAAVAAECTELICGMNLDVVNGLLDTCGSSKLTAQLAPGTDKCCVRLSGIT